MKVDGSQSWYSEHIFIATVMHLNLEALGVEDHASGLHVELLRRTKVVGFNMHFVCFILTARTSENRSRRSKQWTFQFQVQLIFRGELQGVYFRLAHNSTKTLLQNLHNDLVYSVHVEDQGLHIFIVTKKSTKKKHLRLLTYLIFTK